MKKILWLALCLVGPMSAAPAVIHLTIAGRDVAVWKPAGAAAVAGYPVVVFSHGYGGNNTQSTFLMEALAGAGYLVVAPNHQDARTGWYPGKFLLGPLFNRPEESFRKQEEWT